MDNRSHERNMGYTTPIKNIFLTLYLLNNTFNENLFYDRDTQTPQILKVVPWQELLQVADLNNTMIPDTTMTVPILQIPPNWSDNQYRSSRRYLTGFKDSVNPALGLVNKNYLHKDFRYMKNIKQLARRRKLPEDDGQLTTTLKTEPNEKEETEEMSRRNDETIINQRNFFIIIPESTKSSSKQNYSQALNQILKGGKGAANKLSSIIKTKINKTTTSTKNNILEIPQKFIYDIQGNNTNPICIMHEGTTLFIRSRNKTNIDSANKSTIPGANKHTTQIATSDSIELLLSTPEKTSTISSIINTDMKNISEKIYEYAKTKIDNSSTTTKEQTHKIMIPSTFDDREYDLKLTTQEMKTSTLKTSSKKLNNLTDAISDALNTLSKEMKSHLTQKSKGTEEETFQETTCFPVYNIVHNSSTMKVIMIKNSKDLTDKTNKQTTTSTSSVTPPISVTTVESRVALTNLPENDEEKNNMDSSRKASTIGKEASTVTTINTTGMDSNSKSNVYEDGIVCNETTSDHNIGENCRIDKVCDESNDNSREVNQTNIYSDEETSKITSTTTRRQKITTQMLQQNIFSPTLIEYGKQKNGSLLVIKLISEGPGCPEDQVQNRKEKYRMSNFNKQ